MTKVEIKRLDSVTANDTTATLLINNNFKAIQDALENTLSRDGTTPNFMDANLDLNSYKIINSGEATDDNDVVTLKLVKDAIGTATESAEAAANSAKQAATSAQSAQVSATNAITAVRNAEETIVQATEFLNETHTYVDNAKVDINNTVTQAKADIEDTKNTAIGTIDETVSTAESNISTIVSDAEGSITNIAVTEANKAIANAAQEATDIATANVNSYVDGTVKPSLQTYVDQAQEHANSAATSMEQAALSATAASNYASNASADADNAAESAGLAANSVTEASNSEANAKTSETNAKIWAEGTDAQVQALGGEKSAKGWAEASTNLDYTNITNCITKIPQDIKLELNNGTLTLKAGSKVYVPNGVGVFDVVTVASDRTITRNLDGEYFITANNSDALNITDAALVSSGINPTPKAYNLQYNTTDNKIRRYYDSTDSYTEDSFPVAKVTVSNSVISSIDQVFNGFGYIGSTVFVLPGVKGLIPNGRNADGSLKNIEFTTSSVLTYTRTTEYSNYSLILNNSAVSNAIISYNSNKNNNISTSGNIVAYCNCGTVSADSTGSITSFTHKTAFHAVDYNDYARELNGKQDIANLSQTIDASTTKYPSNKAVQDALSGKTNADLSNISSNIDYVVESYRNGNNWYRVYKSGWIEQGGVVENGSQGGDWTKVANLLKPLSKPYSIVVTDIDNTNNYARVCSTKLLNETNFTILSGTTWARDNKSRYACWRACGQGV